MTYLVVRDDGNTGELVRHDGHGIRKGLRRDVEVDCAAAVCPFRV